MSSILRRTAAAVAALALLGGCGVEITAGTSGLTPGWKAADLDRNWLDLAVHRGVQEAPDLAAGMTHADEIISATGRVERTVPARRMDDPLEIVLRYRGGETPDECFRFTVPDGYSVEFKDVSCPQ